MGARGARLISSGAGFGRWEVGVGCDADQRGRALRGRRGSDVAGDFGLRRLQDGDRETAVTVMAAKRRVIAVAARTVVEDRGDLRAARGAGDIDVVRAMEYAG